MCQPCLLTLDSCRLHFAGDKKQMSPAGAHPCQSTHSLSFFSSSVGLTKLNLWNPSVGLAESQW